MTQRQRKRDKVKKAINSGSQKIAKFARSRTLKRFVPVLGVTAIFRPGKAVAFSLEDGAQFGVNASFIASEYKGMREVTRTGVSSIPDPQLRSAVSTAGSITVLVAGVGCGIGSGVCSAFGWQQKAMVCLHGVGICAGIASGLHEADPINPITVPGKLAGDTVGKMSA